MHIPAQIQIQRYSAPPRKGLSVRTVRFFRCTDPGCCKAGKVLRQFIGSDCAYPITQFPARQESFLFHLCNQLPNRLGIPAKFTVCPSFQPTADPQQLFGLFHKCCKGRAGLPLFFFEFFSFISAFCISICYIIFYSLYFTCYCHLYLA